MVHDSISQQEILGDNNIFSTFFTKPAPIAPTPQLNQLNQESEPTFPVEPESQLSIVMNQVRPSTEA